MVCPILSLMKKLGSVLSFAIAGLLMMVVSDYFPLRFCGLAFLFFATSLYDG